MCQQLPTSFLIFIRACFHNNKHKKVGAHQLIFVDTGREKPGGE